MYKQLGDPGAGNINENLLEIPDMKDRISDPQFWNEVQDPELEDSRNELSPKEASVSSPPTYQWTKKSLKENTFLEEQRQPFVFKDWEGDTKTIKGKELKKSVFSHGIQAGIKLPEDLVEYPTQLDPTKYQRKDCSRITDKNAGKFSNKIVDITTSRMVK
jgi:hypothetical protein